MTVRIGETCDAWEPTKFGAALRLLRQGKPYPLTFAEFWRLGRSGSLAVRPNEGDPAIYANDPILTLPDSEIVKDSPVVSAPNIRRLRRAWLYKNALSDYHLHHAKEKTILEHLRPEMVGGAPSYSHYLRYLEAFHKTDLEAFFSLRPLPISIDDLKAHSYIAAGSGHGKSELMKALMKEVMNAGHGVILLDPHGDIADQVAQWSEFEHDKERLFYFAPRLDNLESYPVINPLDALHKADAALLDSTVENFLATIPAIIGADGELSSRMRTLLKPCLYTLAKCPNSTLYDLLEFVSEEQNREGGWIEKARQILTNRAQLDTLNSFFDTSYKTTKNAICDRLRALLSSDALDHCLAGINTVDLPALMDSGKVCVFNLSAGLLGEETSGAFGRFLLCAIQGAAMRRQEQAALERKPVFLFMDEGDRFMSPAVVSIYKETRKYGLHLCVSQQITGYNMTDDIFRAIVGNSRVRFAGSSGDEETARDLSRMTATEISDVKGLQKLSFYARSGGGEPVLFQLDRKLLGNRNQMAHSAWEVVKAYQLSKYYKKPATGLKNSPASEAPAPIDREPINFGLNNHQHV